MDTRMKTRLIVACGLLTLTLSMLSARLAYIEIWEGEKLASAARSHYEGVMTLPGSRGRIYDRSGEMLARSQTVYSLVVDPYHLRDPMLGSIALGKKEGISPREINAKRMPEEIAAQYREYVAETLASLLSQPRHELSRRLKESRGDLVVTKGLEDDFANQLEKELRDRRISGVRLVPGEQRYYPSAQTLTQVIGYVDENGKGVSGIEKVFDEEMQGQDGKRYFERDRSRHEIHAFRGEQIDPVPGNDVYLTIDMALQTVLERELDAVLDEFRPARVTAIFMDPATSEILAMGSRPHFDLSTRRGIRGQEPLREIPAVSDVYQPGSTFKIVGYSGVFDRSLATPSTEVDCHMGQYTLDGFTLHDHHPYGKLTARMAFAKSSNIGAYLLARPLNKDVFFQYVKQFGFGEKTGIELNGENAGRLIPPNRWSATSFSSQVMGYEVAVTPMQMAVACSVIANDGIYRQPTLIKGVRKMEDGKKKLVRSPEREERRIISEKAAAQVAQCMMETMGEHGTGTKANVSGYSVAGKTGTARKHVEHVGYVKGKYIASFMGFLPVEHPRLLGLIVIDEPKASGPQVYGGAVAAPIFRAVATEAVKILSIPPDRPDELVPGKANPIPLAATTMTTPSGEGGAH